MDEKSFRAWWSKWGEHITAISILVCLIFLSTMIYKDYQLKSEISENCGWAEEDYECFCRRGDVIEMKNSLAVELPEGLNLNLPDK